MKSSLEIYTSEVTLIHLAPVLEGSWDKKAFYPRRLPFVKVLTEVYKLFSESLTLTNNSTDPLIRKYNLSKQSPSKKITSSGPNRFSFTLSEREFINF